MYVCACSLLFGRRIGGGLLSVGRPWTFSRLFVSSLLASSLFASRLFYEGETCMHGETYIATHMLNTYFEYMQQHHTLHTNDIDCPIVPELVFVARPGIAVVRASVDNPVSQFFTLLRQDKNFVK